MSERVLVFGDDAKAFLAVVRSLGRKGIEVHAAPGDFAGAALKSRYIAAPRRPARPRPAGAARACAEAIFTDKAETRRTAFAHGVPVCPGRLIADGDEAGAPARAFGLPRKIRLLTGSGDPPCRYQA